MRRLLMLEMRDVGEIKALLWKQAVHIGRSLQHIKTSESPAMMRNMTILRQYSSKISDAMMGISLQWPQWFYLIQWCNLHTFFPPLSSIFSPSVNQIFYSHRLCQEQHGRQIHRCRPSTSFAHQHDCIHRWPSTYSCVCLALVGRKKKGEKNN